jgi:glycosyltransferase involved in cell wall biosynthesis
MPGKIALFIPSLERAGAERVTLFLANGLAERGYAVDVVLVEAKGEFLADLADDVHVVDLKAPRTLSAVPRLASYLRKQRPAVIISALDHVNAAAVIAGRLSRAGTPVVTAVHSSRATPQQYGPGVRSEVFGACLNWCYRRAAAVICVSHGVAEDLIRESGVRRDRVRVIYNPAIPPHVRELARQPVEHPWFAEHSAGSLEQGARSPCSKLPAPRLLLGVGRLAPQKDFATLLRALEIVRRDHDVRLIILGEGNERPRLESLAQEFGLGPHVSMPGTVKNPYAYMARADLFVLSSAWEALPTVLIEALAVGVPVVATDCVSGPREILREGRYGALTPVGDAAALAAAVSAALGAPRRELPCEALRPYSVDYAVDAYCRLIKEVTRG